MTILNSNMMKYENVMNQPHVVNCCHQFIEGQLEMVRLQNVFACLQKGCHYKVPTADHVFNSIVGMQKGDIKFTEGPEVGIPKHSSNYTKITLKLKYRFCMGDVLLSKIQNDEIHACIYI